MTDAYHVLLSYSRNDQDGAVNLRAQLGCSGLTVFCDAEEIRQGNLWLDRLQEAVDACGSFVVLVGRDGVARWISAETQVGFASRYIDRRYVKAARRCSAPYGTAPDFDAFQPRARI